MTRDVRIYALVARSAPRAVVFRRGPSKRVLLLEWNTANDQFEQGQWLKGRIYERRCDLSPDGQLLLYFAANYREPYFSWSAVSRPPHLTALALWPKGDAWGGGGHFETDTSIALNHRESEMGLADGFRVPGQLKIKPFGSQSGWGEDNPVWANRLERDGWTLVSGGRVLKQHHDAHTWITFDPPVIWERAHPFAPQQYILRMEIRGLKEKNGPWYLTEHSVVSCGVVSHNLGRTDWAEWAASGDLLFSRDCSLYRLSYARHLLAPLTQALQLIDLGELTFASREAPASARRWPQR